MFANSLKYKMWICEYLIYFYEASWEQGDKVEWQI